MRKKEIISRVTELVTPITKTYEVELIDVEYVKEGERLYLRIYIDKKGGLVIDDCEKVSRELEKYLDEEDFIDDAYNLEVSSPGLGRALKTEADFIRYAGETVEVKLYSKLDDKKEYEGKLAGLINNKIVIISEDRKIEFNKDDVANVKRAIRF